MALREGRCLLNRRIADRGNDRSMFGSRAHGRDRYSISRIADRGSIGLDSDPRDLKIKRLRKRVQYLETQQEIKWLRHRIRDLELQRETRKTETESSIVVGDEGGDGEQQSFGRHPPLFYEPIDPYCLSEDRPSFDEDGVDYNEDECLFVEQALNGVLGGDTVVSSGLTMAISGGSMNGGDEQIVESPTIPPWIMENLQVGSGSPDLKIPIEDSGLTFETKPPGFMKELPIQMDDNITVIKVSDDLPISCEYICAIHNDDTHTLQQENNTRGLHLFKWDKLEGPLVNDNPLMTTTCGPRQSSISKSPTKNYKLGINGLSNSNAMALFNATWVQLETIPLVKHQQNAPRTRNKVNNKRSNIPYYSGGICLELDETTREVELFRQVVTIVINWIRVDVPFDAGGIWFSAKLEVEFFSKTRSMMQIILI